MKLKVLSSGSYGNSYLLQSPTGTLIIEAGITYRSILEGLNFNLGQVVGAIASHQHLDHAKALKDLTNAGIDIYTNKETIQALNLTGHRVNEVEPLKQFTIGDFRIMPFSIQHDVEGLGYLIEYIPDGYRVLFATDTYYLKYKFKDIHCFMLECNYIKETLDQNIADGYIPLEHKPRLLRSHMSLENLKEFLKANDLSQCRSILLLHLSDRNSSATRMIEEIEELTGIETNVATSGVEVKLELYPY